MYILFVITCILGLIEVIGIFYVCIFYEGD
jgi:hypothetical protein